jgi:hypothetical protein
MSATPIRGIVRDGKVIVDDSIDLPDGTPVTISACAEETPLPPEVIARIIAMMKGFEPLDLPPEVAAEFEDWKRYADELASDSGTRP